MRYRARDDFATDGEWHERVEGGLERRVSAPDSRAVSRHSEEVQCTVRKRRGGGGARQCAAAAARSARGSGAWQVGVAAARRQSKVASRVQRGASLRLWFGAFAERLQLTPPTRESNNNNNNTNTKSQHQHQ